MNLSLTPRASEPAAPSISVLVVYIHFTSPIILLAFFLLLLTAHSVTTASKYMVVRPSSQQTGPGGKPLPQYISPSAKARREKQNLDFNPARKLLFTWLSVGIILSFVGNFIVVILHAVLSRSERWWCGESVAVLNPPP